VGILGAMTITHTSELQKSTPLAARIDGDLALVEAVPAISSVSDSSSGGEFDLFFSHVSTPN